MVLLKLHAARNFAAYCLIFSGVLLFVIYWLIGIAMLIAALREKL